MAEDTQWHEDRFTATGFERADGKQRVHVDCPGMARTSGHDVSLERDNEGTPGDPTLIAIKIVDSVSGPSADVLTPVLARGSFVLDPEVTTVRINPGLVNVTVYRPQWRET